MAQNVIGGDQECCISESSVWKQKHLWCCCFSFLPYLRSYYPTCRFIIERKKNLKTISFWETGPHSSSPQTNHNKTHCWNTIICLCCPRRQALVITVHIFTLYVCSGWTSFILGGLFSIKLLVFGSSFGLLVEVSCRQEVISVTKTNLSSNKAANGFHLHQ